MILCISWIFKIKERIVMANICEYKGIVKGSINACYAVFGSMSCLDDKYIVDEGEKDGEYFVRFEGDCKWGVDMYCSERQDMTPFVLPEDPDEAESFGEDNWYIFHKDKPVLFGVELMLNSADIDDYDPDWFPECGGEYIHYDKNGNRINDSCPEELYIKDSLTGEYPEEDEWDPLGIGDKFPHLDDCLEELEYMVKKLNEYDQAELLTRLRSRASSSGYKSLAPENEFSAETYARELLDVYLEDGGLRITDFRGFYKPGDMETFRAFFDEELKGMLGD